MPRMGGTGADGNDPRSEDVRRIDDLLQAKELTGEQQVPEPMTCMEIKKRACAYLANARL